MRLRVRVARQTQCLEIGEEKPTLGDLRRNVSLSLLPLLGYSSDAAFTITLNGKDPLTNDEESLESFGIISGDLIILLMPGAQPPAAASSPTPQPAKTQCQSTIAPTMCVQSSNVTSTSQSPQQAEPRPSSCQGAAAGVEEIAEEKTVSAWLSEPMLICESVAGRIPHSLESLYLSAGCNSANDALVTVIHLLMLETGFIVQHDGGKRASMPEGWRGSSGVYRLHYTHPLCNDCSVMLACVPMGTFLSVHAMVKMNQETKCAKTLQLSSQSYITLPGPDNVSFTFRMLKSLSRLFKDQLVYPLLAATRQALELPDVFGLLVLPLELKLRIFRLLDVRSILSLSSACKDLHTDLDDPSLWRFLYRRDFKEQPPSGSETIWKEIYKMRYIRQCSRMRFSPRPYPPIFPLPHPPDTLPHPPGFPFPPGIVGGEYDVNPELIFPNRMPFRDPLLPLRPLLPGRGGFLPRRRDHQGAFL
ncbi:F-box only protein 7 [Hyperolius riggenbachi]|uniref:F-box only protein 7 n=1 Tax=Hyperolius riggenbachi TaxID=752182 RepID=UPI0035A38673